MKSTAYSILNNIKSIDLFTKPVQLMIKKEEGHKTLYGAILTLALLFVIFVILINDLIDLKDGTNLQVISNEVHKYQPDLVQLLPSNFSMQIGIQDPTYKTYIDESVWILKFKAVYKEQKLGDDSQFNSFDIPLVVCTNDSIKQQDLSQTFISARYGDLYCIDWDSINEIQLQGQFLAAEYKYLAIDLYVCADTTKRANGPECKSREEIDQILSHNYLSIQLTTIVTDFSNIKSPYEYQVEDFYTSISSKIFKEINFFMQPITTVVDQGIALQDLQTYNALSFKKHNEIIDFTDGEQLVHITMRLDQSAKINQKTYKKLQDVLAQIGGLWNVLFTLTLALQTPFSKFQYRLTMINSLFNFEGSEVDMNSKSSDQKNQTVNNRDSLQQNSIIISPDSILTQKLSKSKNRQSFILQRLNSIMGKHEQLGKEENAQEKGRLQIQISRSVKQFFDTVKRKLKFSFLQKATFLKVSNNRIKKRQFDYSVERLEKQLDIIYIIKKLHEIDKLKMILLKPAQLKVFDYLPRPTIPEDYKKQTVNNQYYSLLKQEKSNYEKAIEAQQAFKELAKQLDDPLNKQLIQLIDENMVQLLQVEFQNQLPELSDQQEQHIPEERIIKDLDEVEINNIAQQEDLNQRGVCGRNFQSKIRRTL